MYVLIIKATFDNNKIEKTKKYKIKIWDICKFFQKNIINFTRVLESLHNLHSYHWNTQSSKIYIPIFFYR